MILDKENPQDVISNALNRHWTTHSLMRFLERYGEFDIASTDFVNLVPRIEYRCRDLVMATDRCSRTDALVIVSVRTWSEKEQGIIKVRLLYNYRDKVVLTALPAKLEPKKRRLAHLIV